MEYRINNTKDKTILLGKKQIPSKEQIATKPIFKYIPRPETLFRIIAKAANTP